MRCALNPRQVRLSAKLFELQQLSKVDEYFGENVSGELGCCAGAVPLPTMPEVRHVA